ncbi:hypothetical protein PVAP13_9KG151540 [Panicum virgatum]|uniref:Uncharacterized protein n=1 Tax=Panicum virgatum TaxID=38727 RepID=A0A8T0NH75_PANVG|nr:hypothetical protein PVAP13_9KG151540 [Panicum virgatum]
MESPPSAPACDGFPFPSLCTITGNHAIFHSDPFFQPPEITHPSALSCELRPLASSPSPSPLRRRSGPGGAAAHDQHGRAGGCAAPVVCRRRVGLGWTAALLPHLRRASPGPAALFPGRNRPIFGRSEKPCRRSRLPHVDGLLLVLLRPNRPPRFPGVPQPAASDVRVVLPLLVDVSPKQG